MNGMNAFSAFGEANGRPARPARTTHTLIKKRKEDDQVRAIGRAIEREKLDEILAGPHGALIEGVRQRVRGLVLADGPKLLVWIEANAALRAAPVEVRSHALAMIGRAIVRARVRAGLEPFDDGIPFGLPGGGGDPPRAMHVVKQMLGVR